MDILLTKWRKKSKSTTLNAVKEKHVQTLLSENQKKINLKAVGEKINLMRENII